MAYADRLTITVFAHDAPDDERRTPWRRAVARHHRIDVTWKVIGWGVSPPSAGRSSCALGPGPRSSGLPRPHDARLNIDTRLNIDPRSDPTCHRSVNGDRHHG